VKKSVRNLIFVVAISTLLSVPMFANVGGCNPRPQAQAILAR
jgi:hypothetical protein